MKLKHHIGTACFAAVLGLQPALAADVVLTGNYLKVGVNNSGSLIAGGVGIKYDEFGAGLFAAPGDFLTPGTPFEFFALGYNGSSARASYTGGHTLSSYNTVNTSAGSTLSTFTTGSWGALGFTQALSFSQNSGFIDFTVNLTNTSTALLTNVVYARGLDPDQDVYFTGGGYNTTNVITGSDLVTGSAPISDWTIGIYSNSSYAHTPSVRSWWPDYNPYTMLTPNNDGNGDYAINMGWDIGTLGAGETATVKFQYRIAETAGEVITPTVPDASSTIVLLGLALAGMGGAQLRNRRRA